MEGLKRVRSNTIGNVEKRFGSLPNDVIQQQRVPSTLGAHTQKKITVDNFLFTKNVERSPVTSNLSHTFSGGLKDT